jgi:hypothetical protein
VCNSGTPNEKNQQEDGTTEHNSGQIKDVEQWDAI